MHNKNKSTMSKDKLKKLIITYINIHRYNNSVYDNKSGYFWVMDFTPKMIIHPIMKKLNNKYLGDYKDSDNTYIFKEMKKIVENKGSGILKYKWLNPESKKIENRISYVFKFEEFNWIIGTGQYYDAVKEKIQNEVFTLLNKVRYSNNEYFFIANYHNVFLSHPYLQGEDFSDIKDIKGNLILPPMVEIAKEKGQGFYTYWAKKNKKNNTPYKKLSYVKNFPDGQMIIGTGLYIDYIDKEIKQKKEKLIEQLKEVIKKTKLGKTGYLYIFNKKGRMLIHPNENLNNKKFKKLKTPITGKFIYDELVKASKTKEKSFTYKWDKPSDKGNYIYDKISWVEYIPELDWFIASSVYTEEFKESANKLRNFIITITLIILLLSIIYSYTFFKNLLAPITILSELALKVSKGDYNTRYTVRTKNDELGILANKFNEMLNTIENRTNELEESNKGLEYSINDLIMTQKMLVQSEKMASLGNLVAGVAHEINTPIGIGLTGITNFLDITELIEKNYKLGKMSQEEFESYLETSKELAIIINLNLVKTVNLVKSFKQISVDQTSEEKREFNLKEYIEEVILSLSNIVKKTNLTIHIKCDKNIMLISYPGAFSQIISNLILNSIKHAFQKKEKGDIFLEISTYNDTIKFEYKDNGKGIKKENLEKIFEPFFTTNREEGGTGLGLNVIYNIIKNNLKVTIDCKSIENKGVKFTIIIPTKL